MEGIYVVEKFLSFNEIQSLRTECDKFNSRVSVENDRSNLGLAIDLFEDFDLAEGHIARRDPKSYFDARWKNDYPSDSEIIKHLILSKFPSLVKALCSKFEILNSNISTSTNHSEGNYLFNEHYVIKEANNGIAFRWHCDGEEQLVVSDPDVCIPKYYSVWCPLDDVNLNNGTLMVQSGTNIHRFEFSSGDSTIHLNESNCQKFNHSPNLKRKLEVEGDRGNSRAQVLDLNQISSFDPVYEDSQAIPLILKTGTVVIFSSTLWHKSPANETSTSRRVYYSQYSSCIICPNSLLGKNNNGNGKKVALRASGESPLCFAIDCSTFNIAVKT